MRGAAGDHHSAARGGAVHQRLRRRVFFRERRAGPREMKREQRQLRRRVDDDARQRGNAPERVERQGALLGDCVAERRRAEQLHRQPHAQAGKSARELRSVLARIVEVLRMRHRRQIRGRRLVRRAKCRAVANQQRTGAVRQEHPLVRIERQRVGARQPAQRLVQLVAEIEERAVRAVDVMPQPFGIADVGDRIQGIDRAGVRRPRARDDGEGREAGAPIGGDRLGQQIDAHPETVVRRDRPHAIGHHAGELRRLQHRMVRLVRGIEHAAPNLGAEMALARADDGVECRHRAAGREQAARLLRKSHPVAQPVERVRLELHERRRRLPDAGVTVDGVRDEVGERRRKQAAAGNIGEVAGRRSAVNDRGIQSRNRLSSSGSRATPSSGALSRSARHRSPASTSPQIG